MREPHFGCHTIRSHGVKLLWRHLYDWLVLAFLLVLIAILNSIHPFYRFISKEMMGDITYPHQSNTVPSWAVPVISIIFPIMVILPIYYFKKDVYDLHHAVLGVLFSVLLTGVITDVIKDAVGRPRPDFFWRCFPDGNEGRLQVLDFWHYIYQGKLEPLIQVAKWQSCAFFFSLYVLHALLEFLEWMTTATIGRMCLLEAF